jgi:glycosyltransferase involved in cell wall biosynthesis
MLARADAVIAVHQEQANVLASHVPSQKDKFFVVANGVDTDDFDRVNRPGARERLHGPADQFVLTFTGQFTSRRASASLFEALGHFANWVVQRDGRFEFRVVGVMSQDVRERLTNQGVPLKTTGYLPHSEAIEQMVSADVLLSVMPTGPNVSTVTPGKVYEYLASERPILAIGPENGVTRQLVDRCRAGICTPPDRDKMLAALKRLWRDWKGGRLQAGCPPERVRRYTRQHLTGELAKILSHVRRAKARTAPRPSA